MDHLVPEAWVGSVAAVPTLRARARGVRPLRGRAANEVVHPLRRRSGLPDAPAATVLSAIGPTATVTEHRCRPETLS